MAMELKLLEEKILGIVKRCEGNNSEKIVSALIEEGIKLQKVYKLFTSYDFLFYIRVRIVTKNEIINIYTLDALSESKVSIEIISKTLAVNNNSICEYFDAVANRQ